MKGRKRTNNPLWGIIFAGLLIGTSGLFYIGCTKREPVLVGFVAELTGRQPELGVQERNGVQMAIEKINTSGGVAGRQIELIVRDDLGTPEGAVAADRELVKAGVVAIIGHATSGQTVAGLPVANAAHIVMMSPTTSATDLSGKDDYLIRVLPTLRDRARGLAQQMYKRHAMTRAAVIYDTHNTAYVQSYLKTFEEEYRSLGGKIAGEAAFSSAERQDFDALLSRLRTGNPEGLLIIASDNDTALIAQRARLIGWKVPLFTSAWAQTETLIKNGGQAVEGIEFELAYAMNSQSPSFLDFKTRYQERFGRAPSFGAMLGYETSLVLAAALQKTGGKATGLKEILLGIKDFQGLVDTFSFDQYGDVIRPFYLGAVRDGKFVDLERFEPPKEVQK
ncbi:MAG: ABC transporter substrate-binding protein [Syntrophales bacterium]|nr:ABC transporter substrate-binding protein [Syntrophales bacterium]